MRRSVISEVIQACVLPFTNPATLTHLLDEPTIQKYAMRVSKLQKKGGEIMAKRLKLNLELPDELFAQFQENEIAAKAKEALVMEFLREHRLSQGKAADLLGVDRHELFDLMSRYRVPVIDLNSEELRQELEKQLPRS